MKTFYNSSKNQFIVELFSTSVEPELLKKAFLEQNRYIDSMEIRENNLNSLVIINLKDTGKFYTAKPEDGEFPRARFIFSCFR